MALRIFIIFVYKSTSGASSGREIVELKVQLFFLTLKILFMLAGNFLFRVVKVGQYSVYNTLNISHLVQLRTDIILSNIYLRNKTNLLKFVSKFIAMLVKCQISPPVGFTGDLLL